MLDDSSVGKGNRAVKLVSWFGNDCLECLIKLAQGTKFGNGLPKWLACVKVIVQNINSIIWQIQKILWANQCASQLKTGDGKKNTPNPIRTLLQLYSRETNNYKMSIGSRNIWKTLGQSHFTKNVSLIRMFLREVNLKIRPFAKNL